jgi:hypothetical protein
MLVLTNPPKSYLPLPSGSAPSISAFDVVGRVPTVDVAPATVAAAVVVAFPTNDVRVAALTTFYRPAQLRTTHSLSRLLPSAK